MVTASTPGAVAFRAAFEGCSVPDEPSRKGARRMSQQSVEAELQDLLKRHEDRRGVGGRRLVVGNGDLPTRDVLTGAGPSQVRQPRVRNHSPNGERRARFTSQIRPPNTGRT